MKANIISSLNSFEQLKKGKKFNANQKWKSNFLKINPALCKQEIFHFMF
uniref:Uncharacterized protein n=1 Tax=Rhizophora mucronata TaxID=61149 RepID=A0A2P2P8J5_RHIMU